MSETKLDQWIKDQAMVKSQPSLKSKKRGLELLKEEIIDDVKVVMRRNEQLKYIEVRAISTKGQKIDSGRGFAQYLPTWHNEYCNGPTLADEYFQALVAWLKGGRKGQILPFDYSEGT